MKKLFLLFFFFCSCISSPQIQKDLLISWDTNTIQPVADLYVSQDISPKYYKGTIDIQSIIPIMKKSIWKNFKPIWFGGIWTIVLFSTENQKIFLQIGVNTPCFKILDNQEFHDGVFFIQDNDLKPWYQWIYKIRNLIKN